MGLSETGPVPDEPFDHYKDLAKSLFGNLIKSEKVDEFYAQYADWFVLDQTNKMKRKPGNFLTLEIVNI